MPVSNRLSLIASLALLIIVPFVLGQAMLASLTKLHLTQSQAGILIVAIVLGGLVNVPLWRIVREQPVWSHPLAIFALDRTLPRWTIRRRETIIAVNVGGCLVPLGITAYQLVWLNQYGPHVMEQVAIAVAINTLVCFFVATPVQGVGIVMPGFVAPGTAALSALYLVPDAAPPVAFVAGVLGPLIGADFFHIHELIRSPRSVGVASIGGAGTFDGIVLSGILAALLA